MEETDLLASLPEEAICRIFSFLSVQDAVKTSILARRWRYVWTLYTVHLNFDARVLINLDFKKELEKHGWNDDRMYEYWLMIKHVMKSVQSPTINELRINYGMGDMGRRWREDLDRWIKVALKKRVRTIDLDLTQIRSGYPLECYTLSQRLFMKDSSFGYLKDLSLTCVDISGKTIEFVLAKYPLLEKLSIEYSETRDELKVLGPLPKLKHLEIKFCFYNSVQVVDVQNLVSFTYGGTLECVTLRNISPFTELNIYTFQMYDVTDNISQQYFPQLKTLVGVVSLEMGDNFDVKFKNLKHLDIMPEHRLDDSFTKLMKACPSLESLTVRMCKIQRMELLRTTKEDSAYESLEKVKIIWHNQKIKDMIEFVFHLVENATLLKKITIETVLKLNPAADELSREYVELATRRHFEELATKLPPSIEFVLL